MQGSKLNDLQKYSDYISSCLKAIKLDVINDVQLADTSNKDPTQYFQQAINLRVAYRSLADGIQANRMLVQLQKQKIQKSKVFLQGLQYYKTTLKAKINDSHVELVDVKEYMEEPSETIDWVEDYKTQEEKLADQLKNIKANKLKYEEKIKEKQKMEKTIESTKEKYQKTFPQQLKKLMNVVAQTSKVFSIESVGSLEEIHNGELEQIHSLLYTLKVQGKIQLNYSKSSFQQLQIVLNKYGHKLYKIAQSNSVSIQERPLKFTITALSLPQSKNIKILVISVSRRQDFTTEEIFSRLFMNEQLKPVYREPQNQLQRNINNKYSYAPWVDRLLVSGLIQGNLFVQKIKERIFCLQLQKHLCENSKNLSYFFPLYNSSENYESPIKKANFSKFQKVSFQEYFKSLNFPSWLQNALNNCKIHQQNLKSKRNHDFQNHSPLKNYRKEFDDYIKSNNLQELEQNNVYNYFKFELSLLKDTITGILIIPTTYPKNPSKVRLLSYRKQVGRTNTSLPKQVPVLSQVKLTQNGCSRELLQAEDELNQKIYTFFSKLNGKNNILIQSQRDLMNHSMHLLMIMQINRMICYLCNKQKEF